MNVISNGSEYYKYLLSSNQLHVLAYIDIITSSLSFIGAGSIIVAVLCKGRACIPEVHPIFQLSCADFLASVVLCVSSALFLVEDELELHEVCDWMISIITALYVTTFFLTMLYAVEVLRRMYLRLQGVFSLNTVQENRISFKCKFSRMGIAYLVVWCVPLFVAIIHTALPDTSKSSSEMKPVVPSSFECQSCLAIFHYKEDLCWEDDLQVRDKNLAAKYLFLLPLAVVIIANFVFYMLAIYVFRQTQITRGVIGYHQHKEEKRIRNKAILYQLVFIICWLPTLILGIISLTAAFNMQKFMWLYVVQACLCPLQGFFNCIIYGWKRKGFTQALYETQPLRNTDMPSYSNYSL